MDRNLNSILDEVRKRGACKKIDNINSWGSLIDAFFTPYGTEFMAKKGYPDLSMLRKNKERLAIRGIFVDAGEFSISNSANVGLAGKTNATLKYYGVESLNVIVVMNGATANIDASDYSVIKIYNLGGTVNIKKDKTVRIL